VIPQAPGAPRSAGGPSVGGFLLAVLAAVWFSPISLVVWLIAGYVIGRQTRWHWWRVTLAAVVIIVAVVMISGPWPVVYRHFYVPAHFWSYVALLLGYAGEEYRITLTGVLWDVIRTQALLGVPVGVLCGSLSVWRGETGAGGAEWSPFTRRREAVEQRAELRRVTRHLTRPRDARCDAPALGVSRGGDLGKWVQRRR
jgi:hypothetical protein